MSKYYFPMDDKAVLLEEIRDTEPPEENKTSMQKLTFTEMEKTTLIVFDSVISTSTSDPLSEYLKSCLSITKFIKSNDLEKVCYLGFHILTDNNETHFRKCAILKRKGTKNESSLDEMEIPDDINLFRFKEQEIPNQFERCLVSSGGESEEESFVFVMAVYGDSSEASREQLSSTKLSPLFESQFSPLSHTLERTKQILQKVSFLPEVEKLLNIAGGEIPDTFRLDESQLLMKHSFVVIEGLDATGKTTLTKSLESKMAAKRISQPPQCIRHLRAFFDDQPEIIRRSYYILGNYITSVHIARECQTRPVIADRFWHSSAVNAIAIETCEYDLPSEGHMIYTWPRDLLLPNLVLYISVTEELRVKRIRQREDKMTDDEIQLEDNSCLRNRLREAYRRMHEPSYIEVDSSGSKEEMMERVSGVLWEHDFY